LGKGVPPRHRAALWAKKSQAVAGRTVRLNQLYVKDQGRPGILPSTFGGGGVDQISLYPCRHGLLQRGDEDARLLEDLQQQSAEVSEVGGDDLSMKPCSKGREGMAEM
jgi:hypothetical protein